MIFQRRYLHIFFRKVRITAGLALFPVFLFFFSQHATAQERCGTVEYIKKLKSQQLLNDEEISFEKWLQQKKSGAKKTNGVLRKKSTYQVPVVVHIINNGEALGVGTNIPDAQVLSQISVLNEDYQRLNADASSTPTDFLPVAGSMDIEFVLAKRTPEGLPTTGIVRVQGTKTSWTSADNYQLKAESYWPSEDYLNIWVCNITDYLGYAQFPVSPLAGLGNSSNNPNTDGVVIAYRAFGSIDDGAFNLEIDYDKGRTATHEIGHFFGLRHIWGDDDGTCSGTDYVNDTPNQANSTSGCPSHPRTTCTVVNMFQNYLDYTDDRCMNIFTQEQVVRMEIVIGNSPRRVSLLTSPALLDPVPLANDAGIQSVIAPALGECTSTITPTLEIRNYGSNDVTSVQIQIKQDGITAETKTFSSLLLTYLQSTVLTFNDLTLSSGQHTVTFTIIQTNSVVDGNNFNNVVDQSTLITSTLATPFTEEFNTAPTTWSTVNPDVKITWQFANAPNSNSSNNAMKMSFFDYEDSEGEIDLLVTPVLDFSIISVALFKFDVAYARFNNSSNDALKVIVLTNCNADISQGTLIYSKSGSSLSTTTNTTSAFVPDSQSDWRTETLDLSAFVGQQNIQLAFVGLNDYGNNLYLDNVAVLTTAFEDLALAEIISPSPVTCDNTTTPVIRVKSNGTIIITSFNVMCTVNNGNPFTTLVDNINLEPNATMDVPLSSILLSNSENNIAVVLSSPNGVEDLNPNNDSKEITVRINDAQDRIPLKENFDSNYMDEWTIANPQNGMLFQPIATNYNTSLYFNAYNNAVIGDEAWLVSPVLDFSEVTEARMFFDVSYVIRPGYAERLRVMASTDCGNSFTTLLADWPASTFSLDETSTVSWQPVDESDWLTKSASLSALAGETQVRIAFIVSNDNGNNVYLDNLQFFVSDDRNPPTIENAFAVYPNPASRSGITVTLNLSERQTAQLEIIDMLGKHISSQTINDALNQTLNFSFPDAAPGMYVVRLTTASNTETQKLVLID